MAEPVTILKEGSVGIIELSRPDKFNCMSIAAWQCISDGLKAFEHDAHIRALLIRAQGDNFCTGADLEEVKAVREDQDRLESFIGIGHSVLKQLEQSPLPVVVAVQGLCLAGGLELMLAADICFASESARFGDQHGQFGLVPGWGGSQRLTRLIGLRPALDLMYSAQWITADAAHGLGLVNHVTVGTALQQDALKYCEKLAERSKTGLQMMKSLAREGLDLSLEQALQKEEKVAVAHLQSADVTEGLAAFEGRRKPEFK